MLDLIRFILICSSVHSLTLGFHGKIDVVNKISKRYMQIDNNEFSIRSSTATKMIVDRVEIRARITYSAVVGLLISASLFSWNTPAIAEDTCSVVEIFNECDSGLLTTTRRLPADRLPTGGKSALKLKLPSSIDLPAVPTMDLNSIRTDYRLWPELVLFILWLNALKSARVYKESTANRADEVAKVRQELDYAKSTTDILKSNFSSLKDESSALSRLVADMQLQLIEKNQIIPFLTEELARLVNEAQTTNIGLRQENAVLSKELTALKKQLQNDNTAVLETNRKLQEEIDIRRMRDAELIQSLKRFVTKMGFVPESRSNLIIMATAPQILDDVIASAEAKNALGALETEEDKIKRKVEDQEVVKETVIVEVNTDAEVAEKITSAVSSAEAIWIEEKSALNVEMKKQQAAIDALHESVKALIAESSLYKEDIANLKSELDRAVVEKTTAMEELNRLSALSKTTTSNDAMSEFESQNILLKTQLNAFEQKLQKSQEEIQSKLDAAKAMARELNSQLQMKDQQYAEKEAKSKLLFACICSELSL